MYLAEHPADTSLTQIPCCSKHALSASKHRSRHRSSWQRERTLVVKFTFVPSSDLDDGPIVVHWGMEYGVDMFYGVYESKQKAQLLLRCASNGCGITVISDHYNIPLGMSISDCSNRDGCLSIFDGFDGCLSTFDGFDGCTEACSRQQKRTESGGLYEFPVKTDTSVWFRLL